MERTVEYGQIFKELRLNRQLTLKQIANETVSVAQLSKFERGESDLSLTKFISALEKMNVSMKQFSDRVRNYKRLEQAELMTQMSYYFYQQDPKGIEQLLQSQEKKAAEELDNLRPRLNVILLRGILCQLDPEQKMAQEDLDFVSDYLFQVEEWGLDELILAGNLVVFYPTELVCRRTREIVKRKEFYMEVSQNRYIVEGTLLNTIMLCVERGDLEKVPEFDEALQAILNSRNSQSNRIDYLYTKGFYKQACGDVSGIQDMKDAIFCFKVCHNFPKMNHYQKHFDAFIPKNSQI